MKKYDLKKNPQNFIFIPKFQHFIAEQKLSLKDALKT